MRFNPRPADWPGDTSSPGCSDVVSGFQSAPGRLAGRCISPSASGAAGRTIGFNPRPADWPGDARQHPGDESASYVSIRARPIGRAMAGRDTHGRDVSIRARPIGRAMPPETSTVVPVVTVSIRARPIGRAMRKWDRTNDHLIKRFQSAPGRLAGRCRSWVRSAPGRAGRSQACLRSCFNPRPADWPGDAQRTWRCDTSFNPRPAEWPGDAARGQPHQSGRAVSIRARPIGRAMRQGLEMFNRIRGAWPYPMSFNPRPADWPGDAPADSTRRCEVFQSAPGRLAGRCSRTDTLVRSPIGFNPRPADWPGDALGYRAMLGA